MLGLALAALLTVPQWSQAQEHESPAAVELASVSYWNIDPADLGTFMDVAAKVVKAAGEANLPAEYGWHMWQDMYTVVIVGQFNKAELDDPEHWMKQFMGTPGEATLMSAFQEMDNIDWLGGTNEIHQHMPDWTYEPAGWQPSMAWVRVHEFWVKSGQQNQQKWNALIGEFMAFFKEIDYPYPVWGNMVRYGDSRNLFVTAYDNPANYLGDHSTTALAEKHGKSAKWQDLLGRLSQLTLKGETSDMQFLAAQSYLPGMGETGSN
jgi:hypothetical protein